MPDLRTVLTETLAHTLRIHPYGPDLPYGFGEYADRIATELADQVLGLPGVAVVELAEADPDNDPTLYDASFKVASDDEYMTGARTPRVCVDADAGELYTVCTPSAHISAAEARSYAAALLAAALSVEGNTNA